MVARIIGGLIGFVFIIVTSSQTFNAGMYGIGEHYTIVMLGLIRVELFTSKKD